MRFFFLFSLRLLFIRARGLGFENDFFVTFCVGETEVGKGSSSLSITVIGGENLA